MIDNIVKILEEELSYIYCYNCKHNDMTIEDENDPCEDCHRKYMEWQLSNESAVNIAEKILKIMEEKE